MFIKIEQGFLFLKQKSLDEMTAKARLPRVKKREWPVLFKVEDDFKISSVIGPLALLFKIDGEELKLKLIQLLREEPRIVGIELIDAFIVHPRGLGRLIAKSVTKLQEV